jgi:hypothetical protein
MPVDSIYRSVANFPPTAADFLSDVEANRAGRQALQLQALGCSVWETVEAASHARKIYDHFRTSYIVVGDLDPSDGQVLATPSKKQPEHATSWGPGGVSAQTHNAGSPRALLYALSPKILSNDQSRGPTKGSTDQSALRSRFIVNSISPPGSSRQEFDGRHVRGGWPAIRKRPPRLTGLLPGLSEGLARVVVIGLGLPTPGCHPIG